MPVRKRVSTDARPGGIDKERELEKMAGFLVGLVSETDGVGGLSADAFPVGTFEPADHCQVRADEVCFGEEVRPGEVRRAKVCSIKVGAAEARSGEVRLA